MEALYMGCYLDSGHHPWDENMERVHWKWNAEVPVEGIPWGPELDNGLCPGHSASREGIAALHHKDGWTALAFWDRSVDTRPGSHSTFCIKGTYDFEEMKRLCQERFPKIWARYKFPVVPVSDS